MTATRDGIAGTAVLTVVAAAPVSALGVGGSGQSAEAGATFATPLAAFVSDAFGNPVLDVAVQFDAPTGDADTGAVTFPPGTRTVTVRTDARGVATAPTLTVGSRTGPVTVTATGRSSGPGWCASDPGSWPRGRRCPTP